MFYRRAILILLVLAALAAVLQACATVDVQCDMKADYAKARTAPTHGSMQLKWAFDQTFTNPIQWGTRAPVRDGALIALKGPPPSFNDVCALARLGHEVNEAMGATHE